MTNTAMVALAVILSYLLGSIPSGLWLGLRFRNVDIREHGSRNIGATNTMRVLGKSLGATALIFDMLKGFVPVVFFTRLDPWIYLPIACGVAAIIGHTFSIFLRFKGGKGVATSTGVFLGLAPIPTLLAAAVFGTVLAATRMVSAASMLAAVGLVAAVWLLRFPVPIAIIATVVGALIIVKHRSNITRIIQGSENKI